MATATGLTFGEVQTAYNNTPTGGILTLPAGTGSWGTNILLVTKPMTIIGGNGNEVAGMDRDSVTPSTGNGATIITVSAGTFIDATWVFSDFLCRIAGVVLIFDTAGAYAFKMAGRAYRHRSGGVVVGGCRIDHCRFRATTDAIASSHKLFKWGGADGESGAGTYVSGSIDHNFVDYGLLAAGAEVNSLSNPGSPLPGGPTNGDGYGEYDWCSDYTFGGGDDTELNVLYFEDNIVHRGGAAIGTLGGGGRLIIRHNTLWGGMAGHGNESGNNLGTASWETYNNHVINSTVLGGDGTNHFVGQSIRGGAHVSFNNRFTGFGSGNLDNDLRCQISGPSCSASGPAGPCSGRNYFDNNWRGDIVAGDNINGGTTYLAKSTPADSRVGSIYASGTVASVQLTGLQFTLTGLDGTVNGQPGSNLWRGFVLVNTTTPANPGEQGQLTQKIDVPAGTPYQTTCYALIDTNGSAINNCQVSVLAGHDAKISLFAGNTYAIYRVKDYFCIPGAGKLGGTNSVMLNGGDNANGPPNGSQLALAYNQGKVIDGATVFKYWSDQPGWGIWQKNNKSRPNFTTAFKAVSGINTQANLKDQVGGGIHDEALPTYRKNDKAGDFGGDVYPTPAQTSAYLRIGADWVAPNAASLVGSGAGQIPGYAEQINVGDPGGLVNGDARGATYPNALVAPAVATAPNMPATGSTTFVQGVAGSYQVTATGSPAPTFAMPTPGTSGVPSWASLASSTGILSGTPPNTVGSPFSFTITATNGVAPDDTQAFTLTVQPSNVAPACSITSPANSAVFAPTDSVDVAITATDSDGTITQVQLLDSINTATAVVIATLGPNPTAPFVSTQTFAVLGSHVLTAKATDSGGSTTTSTAVTITVSTPSLGAPSIVVLSA